MGEKLTPFLFPILTPELTKSHSRARFEYSLLISLESTIGLGIDCHNLGVATWRDSVIMDGHVSAFASRVPR